MITRRVCVPLVVSILLGIPGLAFAGNAIGSRGCYDCYYPE